jgi:hypothetical protein
MAHRAGAPRASSPPRRVGFEVIDLGLAAARHRNAKHEESHRPAAREPRPSAQKPPGRARGQEHPQHPDGLW